MFKLKTLLNISRLASHLPLNRLSREKHSKSQEVQPSAENHWNLSTLTRNPICNTPIVSQSSSGRSRGLGKFGNRYENTCGAACYNFPCPSYSSWILYVGQTFVWQGCDLTWIDRLLWRVSGKLGSGCLCTVREACSNWDKHGEGCGKAF